MRIVAVTDRKRSVRPLAEQVGLVCRAGADMVVLREKDLPEREYRGLAAEIGRICSRHGVEFCADSSFDVPADSRWLPFKDFTPGARTGASVHSRQEGVEASRLGASFVVYGNVFETTCKPGKPAKGLEEVRALSGELDIPVYAIGGISPANIREVFLSGASGACLMSGLMSSEDPAEVVARCREQCRFP